ncbi:hypothetical protein PV726_40045 [Streptomyces europaeiscabiei]|uniref:hypothetical protein n=1 Tax=Streptomyces europaeiscabiei TaxID=146819 RepID=UPI0029B2719F|nr:hypothetical protein [Streptomyces europaeiscabiei]MDX3696392.1 hypothetical protein [Streptomyces europaeiscabiei]
MGAVRQRLVVPGVVDHDWAKKSTASMVALQPAEPDSDEQDRHYQAAHLSDRAWFRSLIGGGHIWWDTGQTNLTNGQRRLCALRAAGV